MNYTYTIERLSTKQRYMRVRYESEGFPPILKAFNPTSFDEADLEELITNRAGAVIAEWEAQAAQPDEDETSLGITLSGAQTYTAPVVPEPTDEELIQAAIGRAAADRYTKESEGIYWTDQATGQLFYLDTTVDSQNRFASARIAIEAGERADGAVWKLADISGGAPVITFRPTSNVELVEWAGLVHEHVQKCFEAEAATVQKILALDLDASFFTEYEALQQ